MHPFLAIALVTSLQMTSQLLIKFGLRGLSERAPDLQGVAWLLGIATSWPIVTAVAVQGVGFLVWVWVVNRVPLGVAFATSGGLLYLLLALTSWLLYGERLTALQWFALLLIAVGVSIFARPSSS